MGMARPVRPIADCGMRIAEWTPHGPATRCHNRLMACERTGGRRPARGAVLIELLLAMTLFLGVLLPLVQMFVRTAGTDRAADIALATHLAREQVERLRLAPMVTTEPASITSNGRPYRVTHDVADTAGLWTLTVRVYRGADPQPLVQVTTLAYPGRPP